MESLGGGDQLVDRGCIWRSVPNLFLMLGLCDSLLELDSEMYICIYVPFLRAKRPL